MKIIIGNISINTSINNYYEYAIITFNCFFTYYWLHHHQYCFPPIYCRMMCH